MRMRICCLLAAVLLVSGAASAQEVEATWDDGPYVGVSGIFAAENFREVSGLNLSNGGGFGLKVGTRLTEYLAVEAGFEWAGGFSDTVGGIDVDARLWNLTARGKLYPWLGPLQPYLLVGIGLERLEVEAKFAGVTLTEGDTGFAARLGAGVDIFLSRGWLANFEVAYLLTDVETVDAKGDYLSLSLGLVYRF